MTPDARLRAGPETVRTLELADFLLIVEAVLEIPAKRIAEESSLHLADSALHAPFACFGGEDFYPDFATKAAVLCAHLVKNHPLRDGNTPVALIATIEFCLAQRSPLDATARGRGRRGDRAAACSTWPRRQSATGHRRAGGWIGERMAPGRYGPTEPPPAPRPPHVSRRRAPARSPQKRGP